MSEPKLQEESTETVTKSVEIVETAVAVETVETAEAVDEPETPEGDMSLLDHLEELRWRLIKAIAAIIVCSGGAYFYAQEMVQIITKPAGKLYYMNPAEAFFTYLKVSVFAGLLIALPIVMYQIWAFVVPALTRTERKVSRILVPASVVLFFIGLTFSYFLVLPAGIKFFIGFATDDLQPMFSIGQYLSFVISFLLPFGVVFELPLVIFVLAKMGIISSEYLAKKRKIMLVMSFVVGAVVSPTPDVFSQTMIAIPILILYELSILLVRYILRQ